MEYTDIRHFDFFSINGWTIHSLLRLLTSAKPPENDRGGDVEDGEEYLRDNRGSEHLEVVLNMSEALSVIGIGVTSGVAVWLAVMAVMVVVCWLWDTISRMFKNRG